MPVELIDNAPTALARVHAPVWLVYEKVRGQAFLRPDRTNPLDWTRVTWGVDGFENSATIRVALRDEDLQVPGGREVEGRHIGDIIGSRGILHPDLRVRVFQPGAPDAVPAAYLFDGYPKVSSVSWTEGSQSIDVSCISVAHERLGHSVARDRSQSGAGAMIIGRRMFYNSVFDWEPKQYDRLTVNVHPLAVRFNAGGRPNRHPDKKIYKVKGESNTSYTLYTFTENNAPDAEFWNVADALRYLLWWHVIVPGIAFDVTAFMADTDRLVGKEPKNAGRNQFDRLILQRVDDERTDSMSVEDAVHQLVTRAGLHYSLSIKVDPDGGPDGDPIHYLRVFPTLLSGDRKPESFTMGWPNRHDIPREAPFTPLDLNGRDVHAAMKLNAAQHATVKLDDDVINAPTYVAGAKFYEVTLPLLPGWLPFKLPYTDNYPGLLDVPTINVLDDVSEATLEKWETDPTDPNVVAIKDYWDNGAPAKAQPKVDNNGVQTVPWQFDTRHPDFDAVADVGRKWIFPTDSRYASADPDRPSQSPYFRTYADFVGAARRKMNWDPFIIGGFNRMMEPLGGGVAAAKYWVARSRPFGSPISRYPGGSKLSVWFEILIKGDPFDEFTDWLRYTAKFAVSLHESAITITVNNPMRPSTREGEIQKDDNWFIWIARQKLYLRVTCQIEGDDRLYSHIRSTKSHIARNRGSIIDLAERFRSRDRGRGGSTNSILAKRMPLLDPDPDFESIDEQEKLDEFAERDATVLARQTVSADPEIPWIAFDIGSKALQLGDSFMGANGVGLSFPNPPELVNLSYENSPNAGYRTKMSLSDLRLDPTLQLEGG